MTMAHGQGAAWPHFANMTVGLWLITSAFALGYRSAALQVSDVASGALVIVLAALSLSRRPFWKLWAPWASSLVGLWLLFAPLVFWAPTAAAHGNDTLVGALVVVFAILAPGMPMAPGMRMEAGPDVPPPSQHPLRRLGDDGPVDPRRHHARVDVERRDRRGAVDPAEPAARTGGRALRDLAPVHPVSHDARSRARKEQHHMAYQSLNPCDGEVLKTFEELQHGQTPR
jgi:hypothetical protein